MTREWSNWSGSLSFTPGRIEAPENEDALADLVRRAVRDGAAVRVVGSGHSSSPLVQTRDVLVTLTNLRHIETPRQDPREVTIGGGITLDQAGKTFLARGLAFANLGDIDKQTVAGAFATGTHGTGATLPPLATHLVGGRLVTGTGDLVEVGSEDDPELVRALRAALGVLGIFASMRLRLVPVFRLRKRQWCSRAEDCLREFDDLARNHRHVDFYWYPRSDEVKIRTMDLADDSPAELPFARLLDEEVGWSNEVIPNNRELRFEEMEYSVPAERGLACFEEVRERVKAHWRQIVGWRVLYRTVAADDTLLSTAYGRPTATISLHQNNTLPFWGFFRDIEPILRACGGRPHWGKLHTLRADDLRPLYPEWERFLAIRRSCDPEGVFLTPYLRDLLGVD